MTDFLQNVHNTMLTQPNGYLFWLPFVKDVIYANALGDYKALVKASGKGSSMLFYLGQPDSDAAMPNENYGREVAELHTVGVIDYTAFSPPLVSFDEGDIAEIAKIFTGWDMEGYGASQSPPYGPLPGLNWGDFKFTSTNHAGGTKHVSLTNWPGPGNPGKPYPGTQGAGLAEGEELIEDLVKHPLCALHMSRRLVQWFLGDDYGGQFQGPWLRAANAFYNSQGDIKATLRELFDITYWSELCPAGSVDNKVRRPLNKVLAFKRALDANIDYTDAFAGEWQVQQLRMGQVSGWWPAPNGYQPENEKWTATMQPVLRFYFDAVWGGTGLIDPVTNQRVDGNGLRIPASTITAIFPAGTPVSMYASLAADRLMGPCLPAAEEAAITAELQSTTLAGDKRRWALFFVLTSPTYQFLC